MDKVILGIFFLNTILDSILINGDFIETTNHPSCQLIDELSYFHINVV